MQYLRRHSDPVFVYGALRSGTTMLHLMMDNHPSIGSPGEADFLFDYLQAGLKKGQWTLDEAALSMDWILAETGIAAPDGPSGVDLVYALTDRLIDSAPAAVTSLTVHRSADIMAALFPEARIIHLIRDPRDVARSSVGMGWCGNSYYGVDHWVQTEAAWDRAGIPSDKVLTIRFEDLMADLETHLKRICDFVGVPFDSEMLKYHKKSTYEPPDSKIASKWRAKAGQREIRRIDTIAGRLMEARGYQIVGEPLEPALPERAYLWMENHLKRWQFNIRRYGFGLFAGHHFARLVGLTKIEARLAGRKHAIMLKARK